MVQLGTPDHVWLPEAEAGIRKLEGVDCPRLRLFFLSLLWRAAETNLFEFNAVSMPANELAQLREMVLHGRVEPYDFYPVTLIQLWTRNFPHNWSASRLIKRQPMVDPVTEKLVEGASREIDHYRFYFDGLIAHMHINDDAEHVAGVGSVYVGPGNELVVTTVRSEGSREMAQFWDQAGAPAPST